VLANNSSKRKSFNGTLALYFCRLDILNNFLRFEKNQKLMKMIRLKNRNLLSSFLLWIIKVSKNFFSFMTCLRLPCGEVSVEANWRRKTFYELFPTFLTQNDKTMKKTRLLIIKLVWLIKQLTSNPTTKYLNLFMRMTRHYIASLYFVKI
jgi:hypothetical protein